MKRQRSEEWIKNDSTEKEIEPIHRINCKRISRATLLIRDNVEFETKKNCYWRTKKPFPNHKSVSSSRRHNSDKHI